MANDTFACLFCLVMLKYGADGTDSILMCTFMGLIRGLIIQKQKFNQRSSSHFDVPIS